MSTHNISFHAEIKLESAQWAHTNLASATVAT